ncbi:MAG: transposase [Clostridia bacterium]|nr:transposase [Clostridia bacterium]
MNVESVGATIGRPQRKKNRLENYDYSSCGAYFITICTSNRQNYFWKDVGATIGRPQDVILSQYGKIVDDAINNIPLKYPALMVDHYVIMPDHIHLLLLICADEYGRPMVAPTMSRVVQQLKGYITKRIGHPIWQKLFYDHVIRNREDYEEHTKYICENPINWQLDELYANEQL